MVKKVAWNKGLTKETDERVKKYATKRKGIKFSKEHILNLKTSHTGKKQSPEQIKKRMKNGAWNKGISKDMDSRIIAGEDSHLWKGGITPENIALRHSTKYKIWRTLVFERDNWTCQTCGERGGNKEAHHIKQWAYYHKLRFDVNNGVTLCYDCHKLIHKLNKKKVKRL